MGIICYVISSPLSLMGDPFITIHTNSWLLVKAVCHVQRTLSFIEYWCFRNHPHAYDFLIVLCSEFEPLAGRFALWNFLTYDSFNCVDHEGELVLHRLALLDHLLILHHSLLNLRWCLGGTNSFKAHHCLTCWAAPTRASSTILVGFSRASSVPFRDLHMIPSFLCFLKLSAYTVANEAGCPIY